MSGEAWQEYLAAAQRLDVVRQEAGAAAAGQEAVAQAARAELAYVRDRLALQRREWPRAGVSVGELPPPGQVAPAGAPALAGGPAEVLDALRRTRSVLDDADALVLGRQAPAGGLAGLPPALRNLVVYGPLACVALAVQLVLSISGNPLLLLVGLALPAVAFLVGFVVIGVVFPPAPGGNVDRTPVLGAAVCLAAVVMLCAGLGILALLE